MTDLQSASPSLVLHPHPSDALHDHGIPPAHAATCIRSILPVAYGKTYQLNNRSKRSELLVGMFGMATTFFLLKLLEAMRHDAPQLIWKAQSCTISGALQTPRQVLSKHAVGV